MAVRDRPETALAQGPLPINPQPNPQHLDSDSPAATEHSALLLIGFCDLFLVCSGCDLSHGAPAERAPGARLCRHRLLCLIVRDQTQFECPLRCRLFAILTLRRVRSCAPYRSAAATSGVSAVLADSVVRSRAHAAHSQVGPRVPLRFRLSHVLCVPCLVALCPGCMRVSIAARVAIVLR